MKLPLAAFTDRSVHLWCLCLGKGPDCGHYLSAEEKDRAERFRFEKDRQRYRFSQGALRSILASYLQKKPQSLCFVKSRTGKPELAPDREGQEISFNLSHSDEMVLVGVARNRRIGVDVEKIKPEVNILRIADRYFSADEAALLRATPVDRQHEVFFRQWTCKEAYLKAIGTGLAGGLHTSSMNGAAGSAFFTSGIQVEQRRFDDWSIFFFKPAGEYVAAVAVDGRNPDLIVIQTDSPAVPPSCFMGKEPDIAPCNLP